MKYFLTLLLLIVSLTSCQKQKVFNDGEIYSIKITDERYKVAKILGSNSKNIYLCIYDEVFSERPQNLNPEKYKVCDLDMTKHLDANGEFDQGSVKGVPFINDHRSSFINENQPLLLFQLSVTDEEKKRITQYENRYPEEKDK